MQISKHKDPSIHSSVTSMEAKQTANSPVWLGLGAGHLVIVKHPNHHSDSTQTPQRKSLPLTAKPMLREMRQPHRQAIRICLRGLDQPHRQVELMNVLEASGHTGTIITTTEVDMAVEVASTVVAEALALEVVAEDGEDTELSGLEVSELEDHST